MSRLIDADELLNFFSSETSGTEEIIDDLINEYSTFMEETMSLDEARNMLYDFIEKVKNVIKTEPTIDAEPVRHGHWNKMDNVWECSECGETISLRRYEENRMNYCSNCGTKMDEEIK